MKRKNYYIYIITLLIYFEILIKVFISKTTDGLLTTILFTIPFNYLLYLLTNIFKDKGNRIICYIITIILTIYYCFQCIFYSLFSNVFSFNSLNMAGNAFEFKDLAIEAIIKNISVVLLFLVPLLILIIFRKKIDFKRDDKFTIIGSIFGMVLFYGIALLSLYIGKNAVYSPYNVYYKINSEIKSVEKFGLLNSTRLDVKRLIFGFDEKLELTTPNVNENPPAPEEPEVTYNEIAIDFDELINNESNETINNILTYFKNSTPTNQNEYTGMFKDKNLIFILAESFNMIAVDEELTPTLYKLTHEGFVFNNYYSPVFLSTTGGEFQAMTGMLPTQEILNNWKKNKVNIKYALGNSFGALGYNTKSYHDWTYTYYNRERTMPTLGFADYLGCGNGIEKLISCKWVTSDLDMINKTFPQYKDYERFATYYVSVSGHSPYNFTGNSIAIKNKSLVADLPYSNAVKAYLAGQIEFDRALEALIQNLDEAGILEDTVISFVGDHYPYSLTMDQISELSDYERDEVVEINRSNLVIWSSSMSEAIEVNKVGSQIDILPTLLNLFGIEYDSRLIVGKDILSDEPGLAIFSNRSWVSDYGTYNSGEFTLKDGVSLPNEEEYIDYINNLVNDKFTLSNQIIKYNMYDYIFK